MPTVAEKTDPWDSYEGAGTLATCPPGTVVVGGGLDAHASQKHREVVYGLERVSSRQWRVATVSMDAEQTRTTSIAYCAPGIAPKEYSTTVTGAAHSPATARVTCPAVIALVFGGLRVTKNARSDEASHAPFVEVFAWTAASAAEWDVTAYNVGAKAGALVALGYCR